MVELYNSSSRDENPREIKHISNPTPIDIAVLPQRIDNQDNEGNRPRPSEAVGYLAVRIMISTSRKTTYLPTGPTSHTIVFLLSAKTNTDRMVNKRLVKLLSIALNVKHYFNREPVSISALRQVIIYRYFNIRTCSISHYRTHYTISFNAEVRTSMARVYSSSGRCSSGLWSSRESPGP